MQINPVFNGRRYCCHVLNYFTAALFFLLLNKGVQATPPTVTPFVPPVDAGMLQRQIPSSNNVPNVLSPKEEGAVLPSQDQISPTPKAHLGRTMFVKRFHLSQPLPPLEASLDEESLNQLLADFLNRENSEDDLKAAANKVMLHLQKKGYIFARVLIKQGEIQNQIAVVHIIFGKLSGGREKPEILIQATADKRIRDTLVQGFISHAIRNPEAFRLSDVERGILLVNDLPGISAAGTFVPGKELGSTALKLNLEEKPLFGGSVGMDNYGSRYTRAERVTAGVVLNDPSGFGDAAHLDLAATAGTQSASANYRIPVGTSGLAFNLGGNYLHYKIVTGLSNADSRGDSAGFNAGLSYPVLRGRTANFYLIAQLNTKKLKDELNSMATSNRRINSVAFGGQGDVQVGERNRANYSAVLTTGHLDRGSVQSDQVQDQGTRNTQGQYASLRSVGYWGHRLTPNWALSANYTVQFADKNLDTSEKLYLGGPRGVRAYSAEEAGADQGQILNLEASWRMPYLSSANVVWTVFGFYDWGRAQLNRFTWLGWNASNSSIPNTYNLQGAGVGTRAWFGKRGYLEFLVAKAIGSNPGALAGVNADGLNWRYRAWFNAAMQF